MGIIQSAKQFTPLIFLNVNEKNLGESDYSIYPNPPINIHRKPIF